MVSLREKYKKFIKNNRLILKSKQSFQNKKHNVFTEEVDKKHNAFTEEVDKIALSANDDKRIKTIGSIEAYEYGTNKEITLRKEEIKSKKKNNMLNEKLWQCYMRKHKHKS